MNGYFLKAFRRRRAADQQKETNKYDNDFTAGRNQSTFIFQKTTSLNMLNKAIRPAGAIHLFVF